MAIFYGFKSQNVEVQKAIQQKVDEQEGPKIVEYRKAVDRFLTKINITAKSEKSQLLKRLRYYQKAYEGSSLAFYQSYAKYNSLKPELKELCKDIVSIFLSVFREIKPNKEVLEKLIDIFSKLKFEDFCPGENRDDYECVTYAFDDLSMSISYLDVWIHCNKEINEYGDDPHEYGETSEEEDEEESDEEREREGIKSNHTYYGYKSENRELQKLIQKRVDEKEGEEVIKMRKDLDYYRGPHYLEDCFLDYDDDECDGERNEHIGNLERCRFMISKVIPIFSLSYKRYDLMPEVRERCEAIISISKNALDNHVFNDEILNKLLELSKGVREKDFYPDEYHLFDVIIDANTDLGLIISNFKDWMFSLKKIKEIDEKGEREEENDPMEVENDEE